MRPHPRLQALLRTIQIMNVADVKLPQELPGGGGGHQPCLTQQVPRPDIAAQHVQVQQTTPAADQIVAQTQHRFAFAIAARPLFDVQLLIHDLRHAQLLRKVIQQGQSGMAAHGDVPKTHVELPDFSDYTLFAHLVSASLALKWLSGDSHFYRWRGFCSTQLHRFIRGFR
jgi:hypothetical protein